MSSSLRFFVVISASSIRRRKKLLIATSRSTLEIFETSYLVVLSYLRFLDMQYRINYAGLNSRRAKKQRAKYAVYNRVVWGVLYNETFPDIQAGFTNEVRAAWRKQMEEALSNNKLPNEI